MRDLAIILFIFALYHNILAQNGKPEICSMVPDKDDGTGADVKIYMYYDQTQDNCYPFRYSGKGGDGNRFTSEKDCMRNCSDRAEALFPRDEPRACTLPRKIGECTGAYIRYFYSPEHHTCKTFFWTGCVGNGNRFLSFSDCNATCYKATDEGLEDHSDETDIPVGIILGVVLGLVGAIILIVVIVFAVKKNSKKHEKKEKTKSEQPLKEERVEMAGVDAQSNSTP
ncbi:putative kunitz-type serine protease inhibitor Kunitz-1-like [Triplophysa rosa]|uniref:Kunitz-type serine protease inhibitor Kunitz-1-like n=1 Tax=Triplophysa rosa TaxID=992332 RepID=A0A9W7X1D8_TRIRA|nr:putative kunitz-type serine protease inhibitor Kunitz-1-like [Triplophysa rosa]